MLVDLSSRELVLAVILLVCDAFGLAVGARLLVRRPAEGAGFVRISAIWLVFGLAWAGVWGAASLLVLGNKFAFLRVLTHVLLFVMAPLAIARGATWVRAGHRTAGAVPLMVGAVMFAVYAWAFFVEPFRVEFCEHRVTSPRLAALQAPIRVAVLADIQTDAVGGYEEDVFRRTAQARPDLVLLPGDFVQTYVSRRFDEEVEKFQALFDLLEPWPRLGVYAVFGDVDPDLTIFDGTRVQVIDDRIVVPAGEPGLQIVGLSLASSRVPFSGETQRTVEDFAGFSIVVGHAPDFAMPIIDGDVRPDVLCIAGHTHGGQVVIPGFGPPLTLTSVPRRYAAGGLFTFDDARLCISRGVGLERGYAPRVRFMCRPEVVMIDLGTGRERGGT